MSAEPDPQVPSPTPDSSSSPADARELTAAVGVNLRRLRLRRGLSLERLAQKSGVSRAMLSQIELGQSTPTISLLWKVAHALDVNFSALISSPGQSAAMVLREREAKVLTSQDRSFVSRALFPIDRPRRVEFYELRLAPGGQEQAQAHPPGTTENLVVSRGSVEIGAHGALHLLEAGDAIVFQADVPHSYRNPGPHPCLMYLVMTYGQNIG